MTDRTGEHPMAGWRRAPAPEKIAPQPAPPKEDPYRIRAFAHVIACWIEGENTTAHRRAFALEQNKPLIVDALKRFAAERPLTLRQALTLWWRGEHTSRPR